MALFKYYLTVRQFTLVTDHASVTWIRNFKEPEGVVARLITRLQPFDFKIVHRPGKHHSHADGLSHRMSRPCKRDTCPECAPLLHQVTADENMTVRAVTLQDQYLVHYEGYIELIEDDSTLFKDPSAPVPSLTIAPDLVIRYMSRHPNVYGIWAVIQMEMTSPIPTLSRKQSLTALLWQSELRNIKQLSDVGS